MRGQRTNTVREKETNKYRLWRKEDISMGPITKELLDRYRSEVASRSDVKLTKAVMAKTDIRELAFLPQQAAKLEGPFSVEVKTHGITSQKQSGRCWCFAGMNILREIAAKELNVEEFKLSVNYITFYDKLEKANNYLEMMILNASQDVNTPEMRQMERGIGDGGYFTTVADLVKKYGAVPDYVMPETFQSNNTDRIMKLINRLLRKDTAVLRREIAAGNDVAALKEDMLGEIYRVLVTAFGEPVTSFDLIYRDKDEQYHAEYGMTPTGFYEKYIAKDFDDYVYVTNEPTDMMPIGVAYTFHCLDNMAEGNTLVLNLPIEDLKALAVAQLKDNDPVWFGCDSGHYGDRKLGIWDPDCFAYEELLGGASLAMSKKDSLELGEAGATHAMILVGVNFDRDGRPDRWKIENSWGDEVGKKGYFVCSDRYFDEFVFECVIHKKHLHGEQKKLLEQEPVRIDHWLAY